jgi:hypothetical protein
MTGSFFISTPPEVFLNTSPIMARRRARSNSVADTAFLEDILSLKYLSCEAPICGHFASHDAASLCAAPCPSGVYAESSLAGGHHVRLFRGVGFRD